MISDIYSQHEGPQKKTFSLSRPILKKYLDNSPATRDTRTRTALQPKTAYLST